MIPQIGDIWLDNDNDFTLITSISEFQPDMFVIIIINRSYRETRGQIVQYGKGLYFHTRIAPPEDI